jgi:ATP-dependent helicase HrpA
VIIAAALSIQDVRERPLEKAALADQAHRPFVDPLVRFHHHAQHLACDPSRRRPAAQHERPEESSAGSISSPFGASANGGIFTARSRPCSRSRFRVAGERRAQALDDLPAGGQDSRRRSFHPLYAAIHRAILSGFLSNIAMKKGKGLFPGGQGS